MKNLSGLNNPYGDDKVISACCLFGMMDVSGRRLSGVGAIDGIANMHDRGNGLGGGFAVYGLYPELAEHHAFHIMYTDEQARKNTEAFLRTRFEMVMGEEVPVRPSAHVSDPPLVWRHFLSSPTEDEEYIFQAVMTINTEIDGAFVFSSGKDMAVFKGVGYPEEIADYFRLDEYRGYMWTAHGRFPTNTQSWWGGAHPFNLLDWTVVHNGEISSYGANRRFLEMFGYRCTMHTDTEVIVYAADLLRRRHQLPMDVVADVLAPPFWTHIDRMAEEERLRHTALRQVYGGLLMNGPFTVILARTGEMVGLTDRIRLRPLTVGVKGDVTYLSSEESAIRLVCPELDEVWMPRGGEPVICRLHETLEPAPVKENSVLV